jgi:hypothetical protein
MSLFLLWPASVTLEMTEVSIALDGDSHSRVFGGLKSSEKLLALVGNGDEWHAIVGLSKAHSILALHWFASVALERMDASTKTVSANANDAHA